MQKSNIRTTEVNQAIEWGAKGQLAIAVAYKLATLAGYDGEYSEFIHQVNALRATPSAPDPRVGELLALAESEGITLPYPPALIVAMEDRGAVVDLRNGSIIVGEADREYVWTLTEAGQALANDLRSTP